MFTGIVSDVGRVLSVARAGDTRIVIATAYDTDGIAEGASIACAGVCLTVVDRGPGRFAVDASAETLARTTLGGWREGSAVNLERPLKVGDEIGGHLVGGHVDAVGAVTACSPDGDSLRLAVEAPVELMGMIAVKGSIAVDGVAMTVNEVDEHAFSVNVIPHTRRHTTLGALQPGAAVNLEMDMLARYVARHLAMAR